MVVAVGTAVVDTGHPGVRPLHTAGIAVAVGIAVAETRAMHVQGCHRSDTQARIDPFASRSLYRALS